MQVNPVKKVQPLTTLLIMATESVCIVVPQHQSVSHVKKARLNTILMVANTIHHTVLTQYRDHDKKHCWKVLIFIQNTPLSSICKSNEPVDHRKCRAINDWPKIGINYIRWLVLLNNLQIWMNPFPLHRLIWHKPVMLQRAHLHMISMGDKVVDGLTFEAL